MLTGTLLARHGIATMMRRGATRYIGSTPVDNTPMLRIFDRLSCQRIATRYSFRLAAAMVFVCLFLTVGCRARPKAAPTPQAPEVTERHVKSSDGIVLYSVSVGPKAPREAILAVNGGPGFSHDHLRALDQLATTDRQVVYFDQRGVGRSSSPSSDEPAKWDLRAQAGDIDAVRRAAGSPRVHLLGFSWGGLLAMYYAAHFAAVESLVLVSSMPPREEDMHATPTAAHERYIELQRAGLIPASIPTDCMAAWTAIAPFYFADPAHPAARAPFPGTCSNRAKKLAREAVGEYDITRDVAAVRADTLIINGDRDFFAGPVAQATLAAFPHGKAIVIPGCGHRILAECELQLLDVLESFFDRPRGG